MRINKLNDIIVEDRAIKGRWKLSPDHVLTYQKRSGKQKAVVRGSLVDVGPNSLTFRVEDQSVEAKTLRRQFTLKGKWKADHKNRLVFLAERQSGRHNRLKFSGAWEVDRKHTLLYRFEQRALKRTQRRTQTLRFKGVWAIENKRRLTYLLEGKNNAAFRFRGTFQTPSVLAKTGEIRYQVGIEVRGKQQVKTIQLFGKWKLSRQLQLSFEMPYQDSRVRALKFKAQVRVRKQGQVVLAIKPPSGKPLGLELILTRQWAKGQGAFFVRLEKEVQALSIQAGIRLKW